MSTDLVPHLTGEQHQFVQLFLTQARGDAVQAVRLMGVTQDDRVARRIAKRYLSLPSVRWHIDRWASQHMSPAEILALLAKYARGDQADFWDVDQVTGRPLGINLKRAKELGLTPLIRKMKLGKDGQMELELYSAHDAMRDLIKIHGMHRQDSNVHLIVEHVMRGMDDDTRAEVMAALGGLVAGGGALPPAEDANVIDAEAVPMDAEGWNPDDNDDESEDDESEDGEDDA